MSNPFFEINEQYSLTQLKSANQPIFIFSTVWRSGSTLFQRSLVTDSSIQVWGEPYSYSNLISSLSRMATPLKHPNWPARNHLLEHPDVVANPHEHFIANWYPPVQAMVESQRAMLDRLFLQSAEKLGRTRFGVKFVRISLEEMNYLNWIYPDAKFIILIRNPWDCWRSYKGYQWYYRWPKGLVRTPQQFGKIWEKQTRELLSHTLGDVVNVLRYEDFLRPEFSWDELRSFTGLSNLSDIALEKKITGVVSAPQPIVESDCEIIRTICGSTAKSLGYHGLKETDLSMKIGPWIQ